MWELRERWWGNFIVSTYSITEAVLYSISDVDIFRKQKLM